MKRAAIVGILTLCLPLSVAGQQQTEASSATQTTQATATDSRLQDRVFQSESLARPMRYRILLPEGYFDSASSYPVLYLLHGWHGDYQNWSTLTNLADYAKHVPIIIVMPDAGDSWYVDSATTPQDKFEQYIIHDLITEIDKHWRTIRAPHRRAIAGLSMGGYGAVNLALKHPGMFEVAGSISGAFNAALPELDQRADLKPSLDRAFGAPNSKTRAQNDLYQVAANVKPESAPYLFIDCGNNDETFLAPNRKFAAALSQKRFVYEYHEFPGAHTWQYWDERLPSLLKVVEQRIAAKTER